MLAGDDAECGDEKKHGAVGDDAAVAAGRGFAAEGESDRLRFRALGKPKRTVPNAGRRQGKPKDRCGAICLHISRQVAKKLDEKRGDPSSERAGGMNAGAEHIREQPIGKRALRHRGSDAEAGGVAKRPQITRPKAAENKNGEQKM